MDEFLLVNVEVETDRYGRWSTLGEPVGEHFAITPEFSRGELTGQFVVTHRPSGFKLPGGACIECCRDAAARTSEVDIDWTATTRDQYVTIWEDNASPVREEIMRALKSIRTCVSGWWCVKQDVQEEPPTVEADHG